MIVRQFARYLMFAALATVIDWSVFFMLNQVLLVDYRISVTISFMNGAAANFLLQKYWNFRPERGSIGSQLRLYVFVSLAVLGSNVAVMWTFVELVRLAPMPARMMTTGLMTATNFMLHKFVIFSHRFHLQKPLESPAQNVEVPQP